MEPVRPSGALQVAQALYLAQHLMTKPTGCPVGVHEEEVLVGLEKPQVRRAEGEVQGPLHAGRQGHPPPTIPLPFAQDEGAESNCFQAGTCPSAFASRRTAWSMCVLGAFFVLEQG